MQKAKLGISVALLGALVYFFGVFTGLSVISLVAAGYILICEENAWLKKNAVRAIALLVVFQVVYFVVGLLPNMLGFIGELINVFDSAAAYDFASSDFMLAFGNLTDTFRMVIGFVEDAIFFLLAFITLAGKDIKLPLIDKLAD